jgi:hypothetical protein
MTSRIGNTNLERERGPLFPGLARLPCIFRRLGCREPYTFVRPFSFNSAAENDAFCFW